MNMSGMCLRFVMRTEEYYILVSMIKGRLLVLSRLKN